MQLSQFDNGELYASYKEPIRTCHIFIVQSLSDPVNDNFMELLIMIDAAKRASAKTINIIMPYYGYARQERKRHPREAISAKLLADCCIPPELHELFRSICILLRSRASSTSRWTI